MLCEPRHTAPMGRRRLDTLLAERGLFESRSRAAAAVLAGEVRLGSGGARAAKPGQMVGDDELVQVDERPRVRLARRDQAGERAGRIRAGPRRQQRLDVGASTGGFTDCLLQRGAEAVIAVDVAYGELNWKLRQDPARDRGRAHQRPRAGRRATFRSRPELVVADVSFISLTKVLGRGAPRRRRAVRLPRDGQAAVRGRSRAGGQGRSGARRRRDRRGALVAVGRFARDELGAERARLRVLGPARAGRQRGELRAGSPRRAATARWRIWKQAARRVEP